MKIAIPTGWAESSGVDAPAVLGPGFDICQYGPGALQPPSSAALEDVEALVPVMASVDAAVMNRLPRLQVIAPPGTGVWDYVDVPEATRRGIAVCNIRDYATDAIAEFVFGAIVMLSRRLKAAEQSVRAGRWEAEAFRGSELQDATIGIIGLGTVGARVAEIARVFGTRVLAHTHHRRTAFAQKHGIELVPLSDLLERSDVITLHARLTDETRGMLGSAELALIKPGAILINTARGGLVDQGALAAALESGALSAAALDVLATEPPSPDDRLLQLDNVLLTPHIAAGTHRAIEMSARRALENVVRFHRGDPTNVVNPEVLSI